MENQPVADDLAREIALIEQELLVKKILLDESRQKLQSEIEEHKKARSNLIKSLNENDELRAQLEMSLKAAENLESENVKNREILIKLEVQTNSYLIERQELLYRCYDLEAENVRLKDEVTLLKEQLKVHDSFQETYRVKYAQTESLINEIIRGQELLKKEQTRLELVCKEGLAFATKVSEEADFQAKFVLEANASRARIEKEMIQLITTLNAFKQDDTLKSTLCKTPTEIGHYLNEWRETRKEHEEQMGELLAENKRLMEELNLATSQIELLVTEKNTGYS